MTVEGLIKYISNSKKGLNREINQDRNYKSLKKGFKVFAVFDGVSSLSNSSEFIELFIKKLDKSIGALSNNGDNFGQILYKINAELCEFKIEGKSTISLLFINKNINSHKYLNIGDSRIYIFTNQFIEQITHDDSLIDNRNIVTRCLGNNLSLKDFELKEINDSGNFLICTDGFFEIMHENLKEYFNALNFKNLKNIKKKISYLQRGKNKDDSTYILIKHEV